MMPEHHVAICDLPPTIDHNAAISNSSKCAARHPGTTLEVVAVVRRTRSQVHTDVAAHVRGSEHLDTSTRSLSTSSFAEIHQCEPAWVLVTPEQRPFRHGTVVALRGSWPGARYSGCSLGPSGWHSRAPILYRLSGTNTGNYC